MSTPFPLCPARHRYAPLARVVGWILALVAGTALAWLAGAMLTGATALAATPVINGPAAGRERVHAVTTGQAVTAGEPAVIGPAPRSSQVSSGPVPAPGPSTGRRYSAPEGSVWDRIARCESGGNWKISTGNGYHGGLQFKPSTWRAFGGTKYAATANKATKAQQIEIAEKVRAKQGWGAWPTCSRKAGVPKAGYRKSRDHDDDKTSKAGRYKKLDKQKSGRVSKRHGHPKKAAVGTTRYQANTRPTLPVKPGDPVIVAPGDTLAKIAKDNNIAGGWRRLHEANKQQLANPNLVHPGQRLILPAAK